MIHVTLLVHLADPAMAEHQNNMDSGEKSHVG